MMQAREGRLAIFDVDGTVVESSIPVLLACFLLECGYTGLLIAVKVVWFATLYKMGFPVQLKRVANSTLAHFVGVPTDRIEMVYNRFVDEVLLQYIRPECIDRLEAARAAGLHVVFASASLEPIVARLAKKIGADGIVATQIAAPEGGTFAGRIQGEVIYGGAKVDAIHRYAEARFCRWRIEEAYSDHQSDSALLAQARRPFAVCPNKRLATVARQQGWTIVMWTRFKCRHTHAWLSCLRASTWRVGVVRWNYLVKCFS